jgi:anti-sigma factor RsiW
MKCEKLRAEFVEAVLGGPATATVELREHLDSCDVCATEYAGLQQTMALLDEWKAPEPSPYFSTRLRARLQEETSAHRVGWFAWLRKPIVATAAAGLIALGAGLLESGNWFHSSNKVATTTSSAVSDLQYLDKNADLFAEFVALDAQSQTE